MRGDRLITRGTIEVSPDDIKDSETKCVSIRVSFVSMSHVPSSGSEELGQRPLLTSQLNHTRWYAVLLFGRIATLQCL